MSAKSEELIPNKGDKEKIRLRKINQRINGITSSMWKVIEMSEKKVNILEIQEGNQDQKGIKDFCMAQLTGISPEQSWLAVSETRHLFIKFAAKRYKNISLERLVEESINSASTPK